MLENKTNLFKKEAQRKRVSWFGCTITLLVSNSSSSTLLACIFRARYIWKAIEKTPLKYQIISKAIVKYPNLNVGNITRANITPSNVDKYHTYIATGHSLSGTFPYLNSNKC